MANAMSIYAQLTRLQKIMALPPSEQLMDEAQTICSSEPACKLFWCERVENPPWVPLMVNKAWFAKPPNVTKEGDSTIYPPWIETIVLQKVIKSVPTEIAGEPISI